MYILASIPVMRTICWLQSSSCLPVMCMVVGCSPLVMILFCISSIGRSLLVSIPVMRMIVGSSLLLSIAVMYVSLVAVL